VSSGLVSPLLTSVVLHFLGFLVFSMVGSRLWMPSFTSLHLITTELVIPPSPAPVESEPPPELEQLVPPRLASQAVALPVTPPPVSLPPPVFSPPLEKITPPKLVEKTPLPTPLKIKHRPPGPLRELPSPGSPLPDDNQVASAGNVLGPSATTPADTRLPPAEGAEARAGQLFDRGDVGVVPGAGVSGAGGGSGRAGLGLGGPVDGTPVAGLPPGAGSNGAGVSSLARPLGGYQVMPRYPEAAKRRGIEGTTLLKIHVSARGLVEDVLVERSAGHQELDLAAAEAVKRWRFEPAKRGTQPVAVWVMLPVRFELR
jgi:protein TonB